MATLSSYMAYTKFSVSSLIGSTTETRRRRRAISVLCQQKTDLEEPQQQQQEVKKEQEEEKVNPKQPTILRPVEKQVNVQNRNMRSEVGSDWLSSVTRHVRIFAAYVDPETCAFDQTQTDKLTIILDPSSEFVWTDETCNKVYAYFQDLVDHYEGAPLTEYTLRLIGSDIEHYIRKLLYDGEIKYNMNARVLNFSMGKPRVMFNNNNENQSSNV